MVSNKAVKPPFSPLICNAMNAFETQWCYVIGIPRDLLLKTALKVQPFSFFFSSTTFSDGLPLIQVYHSATVRNMICHYLSHMMVDCVDRTSRCYSRGSDFIF